MNRQHDILHGLNEFNDALNGDVRAKQRLTFRKVRLNLQPTAYDPELVRATRAMLGASQGVFAECLGVSVQTVQACEQGVSPVSRAPARLMDEIRHNPDDWRSRLQELATQVG